MKRIFISKLTKEFNDLIGSKSAKGIIEEIQVKSYSLGESLPIIKGKFNLTAVGCSLFRKYIIKYMWGMS